MFSELCEKILAKGNPFSLFSPSDKPDDPRVEQANQVLMDMLEKIVKKIKNMGEMVTPKDAGSIFLNILSYDEDEPGWIEEDGPFGQDKSKNKEFFDLVVSFRKLKDKYIKYGADDTASREEMTRIFEELLAK